MESRVINPWTWQDRFGYVQAREVRGAERMIYCAGLTSVDGDGRPIHQGDMRGQLLQALENLETVLAAAGLDLSAVVHLNYYTTDVDAFLENYEAATSRLAEVGPASPARSSASRAWALPPLLVEIEATAAA